MRKKLQVFISSTFTDMISERQAAVDAILSAGHIPTGMEQFTPGDEPQKELIRRWINEADVYLLILGGRYGSIEKETGESYTHWEYNYAGETGMPRFALVMDEGAIDGKVRSMGGWVSERENYPKYKEFRDQVLSKISRIFSDTKDIQIAITQKLAELERDPNLSGWVRASELYEINELKTQLEKVNFENEQLKNSITKLQSSFSSTTSKIKGDHLNFLITLYKVTEGSLTTMISMWDLGEEIEMDRKTVSRVTDYLKHEGLLKFMAIGGQIAITHEGVLVIEDLKQQFPPINDLEKTILEFLFRSENLLTEEKYPEPEKFIDGNSEVGYYLTRLEENGLVKYLDNPFINGGRINQKYKNNILSIMFDRVKITSAGITAVKLS